jgi:hypothetical protein
MARIVEGRNGGKLKIPDKGEPSPNPAGMPKGTLHSKTIIRKWLEAAEKAKNPISGQEENLSQLDIITLKQLEKARKGDTIAFRELLDRMEGKAQQSIDVSSLGESVAPKQSLTEDQINKLIEKF